MRFLRRRISVAMWELALLLILAIAFATIYRLYFSRAVALTQVCERVQVMQNDETADMFDKLADEAAVALREVNRLCQLRRPMKEAR